MTDKKAAVKKPAAKKTAAKKPTVKTQFVKMQRNDTIANVHVDEVENYTKGGYTKC